MIVNAIEVGQRPYLWSKPRRYAPAGVQVLSELLESAPWADEALVVLDWDNTLLKQPPAVAIPVVYIMVRKIFREMDAPNTLDVQARLDVNDVFGGEDLTAEIIVDVVHELQEKVEESTARRMS